MKGLFKIFLFLSFACAMSACSKYEFEEPASGSKSVVSIRENATASETEGEVNKITYEEALFIIGEDSIKQVN